MLSKGICPLRACGTRLVVHKVAALERIMDRFGPILVTTEDSSVKPADKAKMKAYVKKWQDLKVLFGCACGVLLFTIIPCRLSMM